MCTATPDSGDVIKHQTHQCINHFIECVRSGRRSPLGFVNSQSVADIGWAAQMSAAQGRAIDLPLDPSAAKHFFSQQDEPVVA